MFKIKDLVNQSPVALSFDDVSLVPQRSNVLPNEMDVSTRLTTKININIPLSSAAMDTVTESDLAIAMAREGGIGIIHRALSPEIQAQEVAVVKRSENWIIPDPYTASPAMTLEYVWKLMQEKNISGVPVTKDGKSNGPLVGIVTRRDLQFLKNCLRDKVGKHMTKKISISKDVSNLEEAKKIMYRKKIEKLPIVDSNYNLRGLVTIKDIEKSESYPQACKDSSGRLRVGAAIGVDEKSLIRAELLIKNGVDVIVIDVAHGHSQGVIDILKNLKKSYPDQEVIAGNVATKEAVKDLVEAGADAVKAGVGPGSICTTRIVSGVGIPQITNIVNCLFQYLGENVPIIADGGVRFSGDITKAIAAGASSIMSGNLFAGTNESPGELVFIQGASYKEYRGMGSLEALKEKEGAIDRYCQEKGSEGKIDVNKLIPEGVTGRVSYRGSLKKNIYQLIGGLKKGMFYCGCRTLQELQEKALFVRVSEAGKRESHVHDVTVTKEPPNYQLS